MFPWFCNELDSFGAIDKDTFNFYNTFIPLQVTISSALLLYNLLNSWNWFQFIDCRTHSTVLSMSCEAYENTLLCRRVIWVMVVLKLKVS